ncbi:MAG: hypothetical protein JXA20_14970 [Spirochaetes bacterium]|nr:hypothetical protein [Spirochaetota bacterium]
MKCLLLISLPLILLAACHGGEPILRVTDDPSGKCVERRGAFVSYREAPCALLFIQELDWRSWRHLAGVDYYTRPSKYRRRFRPPGLAFFQLIVTNTSAADIGVDQVRLVYDGEMQEPLQGHQITALFPSPVYDVLDFHELLSYRSLLSPYRTVGEIDYEAHTRKLGRDSIAPGETALKMLAFRWIPGVQKRFTLRITVHCGAGKKSIDFNLRRYEYGSHDRVTDNNVPKGTVYED